MQFIVKLDIFPLMCAADKVWITELILIHTNIRSVSNSHAQVYGTIWRKTHYDVTDKNNKVSSEGCDTQYHKYPSSSSRNRWDISDIVCLHLHICRYSICIESGKKCYYPLANEVAKGYRNATVRPSWHNILVNSLESTSFEVIGQR